MKDVSFFQSSASNNLSGRLPALKSDHMYQNQGRTFGPLLGLFLVNLFAKAVTAKYDSYFPFHLSYDPSSWVAYNKPLASHNYHTHYPLWYPIKDPYPYEPPSYQTYPTLTTVAPYVSETLPTEYENEYHEQYEYPQSIEDSNNFELIPAESNNRLQKQAIKARPKKRTSTHSPEEKDTATPSLTTEEPVAAGSNFKPKRQSTPRYRKKGPSRRDKYPQKRRRTTTPTPEYYDSYEDYTERYQPPRRRRPPYNRHSTESYDDEEEEEDDYYYDSFETTTSRYRRKNKRPSRKTSKNPNRNDEASFEIETTSISTTTERINPNTEIVIVRQAQTPTTTTTTTTASTTTAASTTTEPATLITNTTVSSTTDSSNGTYGYGPSNGNEHISFTYGPPLGKYQYSVPYVDWYAHEATKNAIVKRVHDIVGFDRNYNVK